MNFKEILKDALRNNTKIIVTGKSGWGKSEMVKQVAEEEGYELIDFRLSEILPEDLVGIPKLRDDYYEYVPPRWLYEVTQNPDKKYLLFLDEITQGTPEVLNITYKIFDKVTKVGNYELPNVAVVGATNYQDESNYLNELPTPLKNRACMIELDHTSKIYIDYLFNKYKDKFSKLDTSTKDALKTLLKNIMNDSNPRSVDKAVELIYNNGVKDLVIPYIGYNNYTALRGYLSNSSSNIATLTGLEKANIDLSNGFTLVNGKRYDIEEPIDLKIKYGLTDEEYELVKEKFFTEYSNKGNNNKGVVYQILKHPEVPIGTAEFNDLLKDSQMFNINYYIKNMSLQLKKDEFIDATIEQIEVICEVLQYTKKDFFEAIGSNIQYVSVKILDKYNDSIDWQLYANLYKANRIGQAKYDALSKYFKQYI